MYLKCVIDESRYRRSQKRKKSVQKEKFPRTEQMLDKTVKGMKRNPLTFSCVYIPTGLKTPRVELYPFCLPLISSRVHAIYEDFNISGQQMKSKLESRTVCKSTDHKSTCLNQTA